MNNLDTYTNQFEKQKRHSFEVGDTVDVVVKIMEGDKERRQTFNGTVIAKKGKGVNEMFTVRRIVQGEGVERVFPLNSPKIDSIKIKRRGKVRRAKLYYLRDRVGKATKVKEKIWVGQKEGKKKNKKTRGKKAKAEKLKARAEAAEKAKSEASAKKPEDKKTETKSEKKDK